MMPAKQPSTATEDSKNTDYDYYWKNMKDPSVREKFINNQLAMTDSSDSDDGGATNNIATNSN